MARPAIVRRMGTYLGIAVGLYGLILLAFWLGQRRLIYFPGPPPATDPSAAGVAFRETFLRSEDGEKLHAWVLPAEGARGAVLVCHGNAGTIADRIPLARAFVAMGYTTLLFDYRGYGRSTGRPTESGLYLDAEAAWRELVEGERLPAGHVLVWGESLGGAVAIELARRRTVGAVAVEAAFTSLPDVGAHHYPWLPVRLLARDRFDSLSKVASVPCPLLVLHSRDDEIVPFAHGERLFAAALPVKEMIATRGSHNDGGFLQEGAWMDRVRLFFEGALGR